MLFITQYKLFLDIRRRFFYRSVIKPKWGHWNRWTTNLQFSCCDIFGSFRNNVGINCTLRRHTVLDFCWHLKMTLNARFNLKCGLRRARLTYVCYDFQSWPCVTEWTWALTVINKNVAYELFFQSIMRFVGIFERFTALEVMNRSGAAKIGNFSLSIASFRRYREVCDLL